MTTLRLNLRRIQDHSYPIFLGPGIFPDRLKMTLSEIRPRPSKTAVILDSNIHRLYGRVIRSALREFDPVMIPFPAGENNKTAGLALSLFSKLLSHKLDRQSVVVAFGGGVTGDMAGFVASVYLRGIPFIQVPTSLLAMVDSSIGGKTGVDAKSGKNLLGTFHQPSAVIIDPLFLKTLPPAEYRNGLAEVVKHAAIRDGKLFRLLREESERVLALDAVLLSRIIERSCRIKADVVQKDERESGFRQILNFGHTLGHAVEQASGYRIPHGYAVALGMAAESWISVLKGDLKETDWSELTKVIGLYGLWKHRPVFSRLSWRDISRAAIADKKNTAREIRCVMLAGIGRVKNARGRYSFAVSPEDMKAGLKKTAGL